MQGACCLGLSIYGPRMRRGPPRERGPRLPDPQFIEDSVYEIYEIIEECLLANVFGAWQWAIGIKPSGQLINELEYVASDWEAELKRRPMKVPVSVNVKVHIAPFQVCKVPLSEN